MLMPCLTVFLSKVTRNMGKNEKSLEEISIYGIK